jgi:hypothetical protein
MNDVAPAALFAMHATVAMPPRTGVTYSCTGFVRAAR